MVIDLFLYKNVGMIWKGEGIVFAGKKDAVGFNFLPFPGAFVRQIPEGLFRKYPCRRR